MEGRWRSLSPFERRRALTPIIVSHIRLRSKGTKTDVQEHQKRKAADIGADGRHEVPTGEGVRVIGIAARHTRQAKEMLREEGQIDADEGQPEMHLAPELRILVAGHLADPVVESGED